MTKIHLLNFATPEFYVGQKRLNESAKKLGITSIFSYNFEDIKKTQFYKDNKELLDRKKGPGFYCWKPFLVYDTIQKIEEGDILIYCDSGIDICKYPSSFIELCKKTGYFIFQNPGPCREGVKRDCFVLMDCDSERYYNAPMIVAGITMWIKNEKNLKILKEWYEYSKDPRIITTDFNACGLPNHPDFITHIFDQAILALLVEKYHLKLFDPEKLRSIEFFDVDRMRTRSFFQNIIFKIKMVTPNKFKNKLKKFIHHYIKK